MSVLQQLMQIGKMDGVDQYVIITEQGQPAAVKIRDISDPEKMLASCCNAFFEIGKTRFNSCIVRRTSQQDFFIFPAGKYFIGVIKHKDFDSNNLTQKISSFLAEFNE